MRGCFNIVKMMKVCLKLCSMFIVSDVKPIGLTVAPLAVFTHTVSFIILSLSDILVKSSYEMHTQVVSSIR